MLIIRQTQ